MTFGDISRHLTTLGDTLATLDDTSRHFVTCCDMRCFGGKRVYSFNNKDFGGFSVSDCRFSIGFSNFLCFWGRRYGLVKKRSRLRRGIHTPSPLRGTGPWQGESFFRERPSIDGGNGRGGCDFVLGFLLKLLFFQRI